MPSSVDIMHRYLKSRDIIDENAGILASLIEAGRGIDAVELDADNLEDAKGILGYSDLSYCLVNVDGHLLLLYPTEQRDMYMDIQPQLELGRRYSEIQGFTYSEATAARDFFRAAEVPYRTTIDEDGSITFAVSEKNQRFAQNVADAVMREVEEDREYFISRNICWQHAVNQASRAITSDGVSYIGSEGGSSGIRIDGEGALISPARKEARFIPRADRDFNRKVLSAILNDLDGYRKPVKVFYGDFAKLMTEDMSVRSSAMSKNEALDILGLDGIPDIEGCADLYDELDTYSKEEEKAFYTLLRMSMCRSQKLDEIREHKIGKREEEKYQSLHLDNLKMFSGYARELGGNGYER